MRGKCIGIVDEAIFTGATLKIVCEKLRSCSVKSIYLFIPSPESKYRCEYNMQPDRAMLSEYVRASHLADYFDVDGVYFQEDETFVEVLSEYDNYCTNCFIKKIP